MSKQRYSLIDAIRGFAVINMIAYHLCYDIFVIFGVELKWYAEPWVVVWERIICITFIMVSGISLNFSAHPIRRGLIINLFGFVVTAVTLIFMPSETIWFGILNFIGCAMLIGSAVKPLIGRLNPFVGFGVSAVLFGVFYSVVERHIGFFGAKLIELPEALYQTNLLTIFGFPPDSFRSSDYFPILPWIFVFFVGYFFWQIIKRLGADRAFVLKVPILDLIGRYSLWIYLAHQPICYGIVWAIMSAVG